MFLLLFQNTIPAIIDAVNKLLQTLLSNFGPTGTIIIIISAIAILIGWRMYNDYKKDKEFNEASREKDRHIQRLNDDNRVYRIKELKREGWTNEEIEKLIIFGRYDNTVDARKELEARETRKQIPPTKETVNQLNETVEE